jgi:hypothetical protein
MFAKRSKLQELLRLGLSLLALAAGFALSGYAPADRGESESVTEVAPPPVIMVIGELYPVTAEPPSDCTS